MVKQHLMTIHDKNIMISIMHVVGILWQPSLNTIEDELQLLSENHKNTHIKHFCSAPSSSVMLENKKFIYKSLQMLLMMLTADDRHQVTTITPITLRVR